MWSEWGSSIYVWPVECGLNLPSLNTWGSGQGQMGQVSEMGPGVLKSEVFALISSRSVRQKQFLEAGPSLCEVVNEKAILAPQCI